MPIPREAIRLSPSRSCLYVTCDPALRSLALGAGRGWGQDGNLSAAGSLVSSKLQPSREPVLLLEPESWAEPRVAARAPERQMGNGCVSALTFCRQMSKCVCASLSSHSSFCADVKCVLLGRACQQMGAGAGSLVQAAISQRQQRPGASAMKCAAIMVCIYKIMLSRWLHCGSTGSTAKPGGEM